MIHIDEHDNADLGRYDYTLLTQVPTFAGTRTALFVPDLERLFPAVPATRASRAAIWVYQPVQ